MPAMKQFVLIVLILTEYGTDGEPDRVITVHYDGT